MENWQISTILQPTNPLILLLLAGTLGMVIWTYLSIDPATPHVRRISLVTLRLISMLFGVYLVMQPSLIVTHTEPQPAPLAIVFDASGSMAFPEDSPRLTEAVNRAQSALNEQPSSAGITPYYFSIAESAQAHAKLSDITIHSHETGGTYLEEALKTINRMQPETPFAGVVLLSDGADTGRHLEAAAKELHLPVNTVFIGEDSRRKDVLIKDILVDEFAFSRKPNPLDVVLENHGLAVTRVDVSLFKDGKLLQQKPADLIDGHGRLTFNVVPRQPGTHIYTASIPALPGDQYIYNNTRHAALNVVRDKYRVLHLSGAPTWDQRFLRDVLKDWPQIDLVSFYLLRNTYQSTTQSTAGLSLIPFPTEQLFMDHLREFDVIIFQDFDPAAVGVDQYLSQIANYVTDGGALILMGGPVGLTAPTVANSPLADLLPVTFLKANLPSNKLISDIPFTPTLTDAGKRHPLFYQESHDASAEELLRSLPRLAGIAKVKQVRDNGLPLLIHNGLQIEDGAAPLLSVSEAKNGRVMVIATDSMWHWGFPAALSGAPSAYYNQFWKQTIRWLTQSPEMSRISLDISNLPSSGGAVQFRTTVKSLDYLPAAGESLQIKITWTDNAEQTQRKIFLGSTNNIGEYLMKWVPIGTGPHRITVSNKKQQLKIEKSFLVADRNAEMNHLTANGQRLKKISQISDGQFFENEFRLQKLKLNAGPRQKILSRKDYALWSHPLTLAVLLGLLMLDWWLRKRQGIL
ncbi:MAG: hypothetical protein JXX29_21965 [Deltaproteobacteria bacterium]|nr:hypothetical protein [Deltaproteobacteria bacterium]MBN2674362.1 hypothetical protein [Deltaproteobacteria bacterium]